MKNYLKQIGFLPLLVIFIFLGCNNDSSSTDDDGGGGGDVNERSLVKSISFTYDSNVWVVDYYLSYNTDGNLQSLVTSENEGIENFSWYSGSLQTFYDWDIPIEGNFIRNSAGYVTSGEIEFTLTNPYASTRTITSHYTATYNNNNQLVQIDVTRSASDSDNPCNGETDIVWDNDNIVLIEIRAPYDTPYTTIEYEYYLDKTETRDVGLKYLPFDNNFETVGGGDPIGWTSTNRTSLFFYQNNPMLLSKNLPKKRTTIFHLNNTVEVIEYFYDFDDRGRVVLQTATTNNLAAKHTYEYFD